MLGLALAVAAVLKWGHVAQVDLSPRFNAEAIDRELDVWLAEQEQEFPDLTPGTEKQVIWAGGKGVKTPLAVVYLHGFTGSAFDVKPVPGLVAKALGANLFYTRLAGHGLDGTALGAATPEDWIADTAEALEIGRRLGDRLLIIGTSTGGTLATIAMAEPATSDDVAGLVLISPNFRMKSKKARVLDLGYAKVWAPWFMGKEYSVTPTSQDHATYWTNTYPLSALFSVAALIRVANTLDLTKVVTPLLILYSPDDQIVEQARTVTFLKDWGGAVRWEPREMSDEDDPNSHMITGDIRSPTQSAPTVAIILDWAKGLGP